MAKKTKMLVKDWNERYAGKHVRGGYGYGCFGTLCGYVSKDGVIEQLLVAVSPDERREYPVEQVELQ